MKLRERKKKQDKERNVVLIRFIDMNTLFDMNKLLRILDRNLTNNNYIILKSDYF